MHFNSYILCYHFIEFTGPDFTWPSTSDMGERRMVFDYIVNPNKWFREGEGKELATNTLAYRRLIESGTLDPSRGSHIHLINGKLVRYGPEISGKKYNELLSKYPGMYYAPIVEEKPVVRRFSSVTSTGVQTKE